MRPDEMRWEEVESGWWCSMYVSGHHDGILRLMDSSYGVLFFGMKGDDGRCV